MKAKKKSIKSFFLRLTILLFFILTVFIIYLDGRVRDEFSGSAWKIPATLYARPLSLNLGREISLHDFINELALLGYRQSVKAVHPGQYERYENVFVIHLREFQFWDGLQPAQVIELAIEQGKIASLKEFASRQNLNFLRLEPLLLDYMQTGNTEDRELVQLSEVPHQLVATLLLLEDRNFYQHFGLSLSGIARALWQNISQGRVTQGGSTLTQQLVKNHFLSRDRNLWRKMTEAIMALLLEWHYDKPQILEAYINEIYLGQNGNVAIHGFARAARFYFDKKLNELNTAEIATLLALVRGPSFYNPRRHPERALKRRNFVLEQMLAAGIIDEAAYQYATQRRLAVLTKPPQRRALVPAVKGLVRRELARDYTAQDLATAGLKIFTTIDPLKQEKLEKSVQNSLQRLDPGARKQLQAAAIALDYHNGEVLAAVADRNPDFAGFNRLQDAYRQTGSLIKPFVYLLALERPSQFNLLTPIDDKPLRLTGSDGSDWRPQNYDHRVHGRVPLIEALTQSYNLATARLALKLGVPDLVQRLESLGHQRDIPPYPSIALGAYAMSPLEVLSLYQVIANRGMALPVSSVIAVTDHKGQPLHRFPRSPSQLIEPGAAYLLNYALHQVTQVGTARSLAQTFSQPLAGKTGTTNDLRDSWYVGYGGSSLTLVWLGRDDNKPAGYSGASGALQVWRNFYRQLAEPGLDLAPPAEIQWAMPERSMLEKLLPCDDAKVLPFIEEYLPANVERCSSPY